MLKLYAIVLTLSLLLVINGTPVEQEKRMLLIYRPKQCTNNPCFQDPCNYSKCPSHPEATCHFDCSCNAFFLDQTDVPVYCETLSIG